MPLSAVNRMKYAMKKFTKKAKNEGFKTNKDGEVINPSKDLVKRFDQQFSTKKK